MNPIEAAKDSVNITNTILNWRFSEWRNQRSISQIEKQNHTTT
jgi:hypothetical protein